MKLFDSKLELQILKALTKLPDLDAAKMSAKLDDSHFNYKPALECYKRWVFLAAKDTKLRWKDLASDPGISEDTRKLLKQYKDKPNLDPKILQHNLASLNNYRKARILYKACKKVADKLAESQTIDVISPLIQDMREQLTIVSKDKGGEDQFLHIGRNVKDMLEVVDKVLSTESQRFIPTGFANFDNMNTGFGRGTVTILAGTTGGGKSTVAQQLIHNMANYGARCCMVPLEMDKEEMMARQLAMITGTDIGVFQNPADRTTKKERAVLREAIIKRAKKLYKKDALETYFVPEGDLSSDDLFILLAPMGYDVVCIDYVGLLSDADGEDQWRQLGNILRKAKVFARNTNTAIVVNAQLSDSGFISYSKTMKEHADLVWTWIHDEESRETGILDIKIAKARKQREFNFKLKADFAQMRVADYKGGDEKREKHKDKPKKREKEEPEYQIEDEDEM